MASDADGKNPHSLVCKLCKSIVLRDGHGDFVNNKQIELPSVSLTKEEASNQDHKYETFNEWWLVQDVMTFENVGVTNAHDGKRYLCCADCEHGPIGVQIESSYYVAPARLLNKTN